MAAVGGVSAVGGPASYGADTATEPSWALAAAGARHGATRLPTRRGARPLARCLMDVAAVLSARRSRRIPRAPTQKPTTVKLAETRPKAASRRSRVASAAPVAGCRKSENTLSSTTVMLTTSSSAMAALVATTAHNLHRAASFAGPLLHGHGPDTDPTVRAWVACACRGRCLCGKRHTSRKSGWLLRGIALFAVTAGESRLAAHQRQAHCQHDVDTCEERCEDAQTGEVRARHWLPIPCTWWRLHVLRAMDYPLAVEVSVTMAAMDEAAMVG